MISELSYSQQAQDDHALRLDAGRHVPSNLDSKRISTRQRPAYLGTVPSSKVRVVIEVVIMLITHLWEQMESQIHTLFQHHNVLCLPWLADELAINVNIYKLQDLDH